MSDISEYGAELDAAVDIIAEAGHGHITVVAHSTGGLITPLWLADRSSLAPVDAIVLNSPFLDIRASRLAKSVIGPSVEFTARFRPAGIIPVPDPGLYGRSIHSAGDGEWQFDVEWKPLTGVPIRTGWLAAVRRAQRRLRHNLGLGIPILVLCSTNTVRARQWSDAFATGDAVLDADKIADYSTRLGRNVTCIRIADAMHDIFLSKKAVREHAYQTVDEWLRQHGK
jgi:alpha-beta hydrolase superfamily lysophospholipase